MDDLDQEVANIRAAATDKEREDAVREEARRIAIATGDAEARRLLSDFVARMPPDSAVDFLTTETLARSAPARRNLLGFRRPDRTWKEAVVTPVHSA